jgi:hypothetical protein
MRMRECRAPASTADLAPKADDRRNHCGVTSWPRSAPTPAKLARCPHLDPALAEESKRMTPIAGVGRDFDALTATLMGSEARKNARLRQAIGAYEGCRRAGHKS